VSPEHLIQTAINPALSILPVKMDTKPARAMMVAIALQESRILHRRQIGGPARGYWQFEQGGGVMGVLTHHATKPHIQIVLQALDYPQDYDAGQCYVAIEHNDILAAAFARLNLWWASGPLPGAGESVAGWQYYLNTWRPGKPHRHTWDAFYAQAWAVT